MNKRRAFKIERSLVGKSEFDGRREKIIHDGKGWTAEMIFPAAKGWEKVIYKAVLRNSNYLISPVMRYVSGKRYMWVFRFTKGVMVFVEQKNGNKYASIRISHGAGRWLRFRVARDLLKRSSATARYVEKCTKIDHCVVLSEIYARSKEEKTSMKKLMLSEGEKFERMVKNRRTRKARLISWDNQFQREVKKKNSN